MKLTDIELASLIDALLYVEGERGSTSSEVDLVSRFCDELRERGYSWNSNDRGLMLNVVIDQLHKP
ncbi:hypothetical protein [Sporosarcina sp. BP05]|uniref:hypothetical protein n=1 Tax=Sporosarcina sp. BP05 TaxID=2758726 RepID=UPI001649702D|nr:hypothetical protein [Sporosarcina sp. BP05]